jgi:hypothetical protein
MDYPVGAPTLEIRSVTLATSDPGDAVFEGKPLVDEFGRTPMPIGRAKRIRSMN